MHNIHYMKQHIQISEGSEYVFDYVYIVRYAMFGNNFEVIAVTFLYYALSIINIVHRIYYGAHLNKLVF